MTIWSFHSNAKNVVMSAKQSHWKLLQLMKQEIIIMYARIVEKNNRFILEICCKQRNVI